LTDGFSFGVIPASHHPRVVCLSACASGYNCKNVHARGRQPPLPSHLLRFSISSTASLCDWQAKAILGPVSLLDITSRRDNIAVCGSACRQPAIYQVRFRHLAILFAAAGLAIECSGIMDSGGCLAAPLQEHLSLTMASPLPRLIPITHKTLQANINSFRLFAVCRRPTAKQYG